MRKITKFQKRVYELCKKVPRGKVTTYKAIAEKMKTKAYRAIGTAMHVNPYGIFNCKGKKMVPCHRVVGSDGHLVGFASGLKKKAKLLKKEGIKIKKFKIENFDKVLVK